MRFVVVCNCLAVDGRGRCGREHDVARNVHLPQTLRLHCHDCERPIIATITAERLHRGDRTQSLPANG